MFTKKIFISILVMSQSFSWIIILHLLGVRNILIAEIEQLDTKIVVLKKKVGNNYSIPSNTSQEQGLFLSTGNIYLDLTIIVGICLLIGSLVYFSLPKEESISSNLPVVKSTADKATQTDDFQIPLNNASNDASNDVGNGDLADIIAGHFSLDFLKEFKSNTPENISIATEAKAPRLNWAEDNISCIIKAIQHVTNHTEDDKAERVGRFLGNIINRLAEDFPRQAGGSLEEQCATELISHLIIQVCSVAFVDIFFNDLAQTLDDFNSDQGSDQESDQGAKEDESD